MVIKARPGWLPTVTLRKGQGHHFAKKLKDFSQESGSISPHTVKPMLQQGQDT